MDRLTDRGIEAVFNFFEKMSTITMIRYLIVIGWLMRIFAVCYNIIVLFLVYSQIAVKNNLRLFLIVFTVLFCFQGAISFVRNKPYFEVVSIMDVQDTNELGLLANAVDALLIFWCLFGVNWMRECTECSYLTPLLYKSCNFWILFGIFLTLSPLLAIILLLIFVACCKPSLPCVIYGKDKLPNENAVCSICLMDYEEGEKVKILPCRHHYHDECVDNWLNVDDVCPSCRSPINILAKYANLDEPANPQMQNNTEGVIFD